MSEGFDKGINDYIINDIFRDLESFDSRNKYKTKEGLIRKLNSEDIWPHLPKSSREKYIKELGNGSSSLVVLDIEKKAENENLIRYEGFFPNVPKKFRDSIISKLDGGENPNVLIKELGNINQIFTRSLFPNLSDEEVEEYQKSLEKNGSSEITLNLMILYDKIIGKDNKKGEKTLEEIEREQMIRKGLPTDARFTGNNYLNF